MSGPIGISFQADIAGISILLNLFRCDNDFDFQIAHLIQFTLPFIR